MLFLCAYCNYPLIVNQCFIPLSCVPGLLMLCLLVMYVYLTLGELCCTFYDLKGTQICASLHDGQFVHNRKVMYCVHVV